MKFKCTLIVVILFQAMFGAMSLEERIIFNKYQVIEEPIKVGFVSSFRISIDAQIFSIKSMKNPFILDVRFTVRSSVKNIIKHIFIKINCAGFYWKMKKKLKKC